MLNSTAITDVVNFRALVRQLRKKNIYINTVPDCDIEICAAARRESFELLKWATEAIKDDRALFISTLTFYMSDN